MNKKMMFRVGVIKLCKYLLLTLLCLFVQYILNEFGMLKLFDRNMKYITIEGVLISTVVLVLLFSVYIFFQRKMSPLFIMLKRQKQRIIMLIFLFEIVLVYKSHGLFQLLISIIVCLTLYIILDYETTKTYKYGLEETVSIDSNYAENSVVGVTNLTIGQRKAFFQLKDLVDKRKSKDSFNVALIGEWGSGKNCIADTLIYEYEKENKYFILKIGVLTLKETKNVVYYVKGFFEDLFDKYEIGIGNKDIAFFTTLSRCFDGEEGNVSKIIRSVDENCFFDLEKEKELFEKQILKLLKITGRKNILLFIDDTDRSDDKEQIIKLLIEFASIKGIISIVSLDKNQDRVIRPGFSDNVNKDKYDSIDKYIHVRIRIEKNRKIEYDERISKQMIVSFDNIWPRKKGFIYSDGEYIKGSLFNISKDYYTTEINKDKKDRFGSTFNILTEILFWNVKRDSKQLGYYFEKLISEYICNSKEISPYIIKMCNMPINKWTEELYSINFQWINWNFSDEDDWLVRLYSNAQSIFWTICHCVESLDNICLETEEIMNDINDIEDVYEYWMINQFPDERKTWKNRKEQKTIYSGIEDIKLIVLKEEYNLLNDKIKNNKYEEAKKFMFDKMKEVINLFLLSMVLLDFMEYFRDILNNYRTFKMQLREAELLHMNYFDYLIKEWQPRKEVIDNFEKMKSEWKSLKNINCAMPSINTFFNNVLYNKYILKFGQRFFNGELKGSRLFLYYGSDEAIIVITKKDMPVKEGILLDVTGERIINISSNTLEEIKKINEEIWSI